MANGTATITIKDCLGNLLSGVSVVGNSTTVTTGTDGTAAFTLTAGTYTFTATKSGYAGYEENTVSLTVADDTAVTGTITLTFTSSNACPMCAWPYLIWDEGGAKTGWGFDVWYCPSGCGYVTPPTSDFPDPT